MGKYSAGKGGFDLPQSKSSGMGIQELTPFFGNMAMMNRMLQMGQMGQQQAASGQTPPGYVGTRLQPGQPAPEMENPQGQAQVATTKASALNPVEAKGEYLKKSYSQLGATVHAIDLINQAESQYKDIHKEVFDPKTGEVLPQYKGMDGAKYATQKYINGVSGRGDPKLASFAARIPNLVSDLQRANAETGNISMQKEIREGAALPQLQPGHNLLTNLMMSDDPERVLQKFEDLKGQYMLGYKRNIDVINSGGNPPELGQGVSSVVPQGNQASSGSSQVKDPLEGRYISGPSGRKQRRGGQWVPA